MSEYTFRVTSQSNVHVFGLWEEAQVCDTYGEKASSHIIDQFG